MSKSKQAKAPLAFGEYHCQSIAPGPFGTLYSLRNSLKVATELRSSLREIQVVGEAKDLKTGKLPRASGVRVSPSPP